MGISEKLHRLKVAYLNKRISRLEGQVKRQEESSSKSRQISRLEGKLGKSRKRSSGIGIQKHGFGTKSFGIRLDNPNFMGWNPPSSKRNKRGRSPPSLWDWG